MLLESSQLLTAIILGLITGSLLTEAMVLVPFWQSMPAAEFFRLHHTMGPRLYAYFSPLTILATLIPAFGAILAAIHQPPTWPLSGAVGGLMLAILAIYFQYFKAANTGFASGKPGVEELPAELIRWGRWHWLRTVLALIAFVLSLLALR